MSARPPDRLPDADRQPRGRHAARARGAARGRRRRLRGHPPHPRAARPLRRRRDARQLPRAQRARARRRARGEDARRRGRRARVRRRHAARLRSRASCSSRRASPPGSRSRCCRDRRRRWRRSWRSALPADRWRFVGFLPRKRAELEQAFASPETLVAFESPKRVAASLQVLAELDPERPVAVCRELTKLHEEIVRGTAAELAARYASEPPRGEVVLVVGGAPSRRGRDRAGARRAAPAGRRRRQAAPRRVRRVGADRGRGQPAVPRADR